MIFNYDVSAVLAELGNIDFAEAQNVSVASENLDNYTSGGIWYFPLSYTPVNKPTAASGFGYLIVVNDITKSSARLAQFWIDTTRTSANVWIRTSSTSVLQWGDWLRFITEADTLMTAADISSGVTAASPLPTGVTAVNNITVVQAGNVVTVSVSIDRDSTAITSYTTVASGLPIPAKRPTVGNTTIPFGSIFANDTTFGRPLNLSVSTNGNLQVIRGGIAGTYMGTFTYLTNDFSKLNVSREIII